MTVLGIVLITFAGIITVIASRMTDYDRNIW